MLLRCHWKYDRNQIDLTLHTAISREVVGKNVHATIPKGNIGYDQYTVPDTSCSCRTTLFLTLTVAVEATFVAFL